MRFFIDAIKISYLNLTAAKFRSFLTTLGVIIGVSSVIIVISIGNSAQALILDQIKKNGSNLLAVLPGASEEKGPPVIAFGIITTTLKNRDAKAIATRGIPDIEAVASYVTGSVLVKNRETSIQCDFQGVNSTLLQIENIEIAEGRFFNQSEDESLARSVVLGSEKAKEFFPAEDPIGKTLTVKNLKFNVVGVLKERGQSGFSNSDKIIYFPLLSAQKLILGIDYLNAIRIKIKNEDNLAAVMEEIRILLRERHNIESSADDDFSVRSITQALNVLSSVTDVLKYFLVAISAISLLVGGIGIMNIMLISVKQRIWEIGLRKAIGARKKNILFQFLTESVFLTLFGGLSGIAFGVLIAYLISLVVVSLGYEWRFIVTTGSILLSFGISFLVGIIFGMYPAYKAGKVSPMEALRYE